MRRDDSNAERAPGWRLLAAGLELVAVRPSSRWESGLSIVIQEHRSAPHVNLNMQLANSGELVEGIGACEVIQRCETILVRDQQNALPVVIAGRGHDSSPGAHIPGSVHLCVGITSMKRPV